jgi:hypothetical protein
MAGIRSIAMPSHCTWVQLGTAGRLSPEAGRGLQKVRALFQQKGRDLFITSLGEGDHSMRSRHYGEPIAFSDAWDQRPDPAIEKEDMEGVLGDDFDVVDEGTHTHVEYDPKK